MQPSEISFNYCKRVLKIVWNLQKLNVCLLSGKINFHWSLNKGRWNQFENLLHLIGIWTLFQSCDQLKFHFFISNNSSVCATIAQTEAIGKCHLSSLYLLVGFVLLDESIIPSRNVKFWFSISKLLPGTCLFNQLV